ncbi:MAG: phosphatidate cytidylyltransferase [Armatimonadetes bacterium CG_4_10_14_3_um_filter_66_18]|nr:phosphatidate cytidylyltransferase [Armatimonadota bacterium]OIP01810.1 MAG: hypothetical protein AUJ96_17090 [Armatimonadetes bacterium CG2_30_66_41]PIU93824.1 MAG: phosphatidate cytidylyltransferase [Armatimonadetes bacterium CG06_land_8_20_14_3_00_66_21]PIW20790.1 MAG: phosphatidate cytidylyltransferase [Armatimonadetes bacterium CG17_big_fil_post_rev_8_21_14_2_50_66_6]PIX37418.1 MAG: phosphatidate cytidylyltransferase [Armatimonadetes bacterium CG_4_8_14_3_um_filter_66_20]PIY39563.1 MAG
MLLYRALSALVGLPLAVVLVCSGGLWLAVPVCALVALGFGEFADKARAKNLNVIAPLGYAVSVALVVVTYARTLPAGAFGRLSPDRYDRALLGLLFLLVMGSLILYVFRYHRDQRAPVVADVSATVLGALYLGVAFSFFVLLRDFHSGETPVAIPGFAGHPQQFGARVLLLLFCATWATDTGAYFAGKNLGERTPFVRKHKLTPASPNKTWEGCVGGFVAAVLVGLAFGSWFQLPLLLALLVGAVAGVMGQFGDLCKSIMKRDLGTKDFGSLIPGHGGVLDRFDSLMMNVPAVYLLLIAVM